MATILTLTVFGSVSHAISTAAKCGSVVAMAAAHTVSFAVSGSAADSQVSDLSMLAKLSQRFSTSA